MLLGLDHGNHTRWHCRNRGQAAERSHGLSIFGDLKYPADFKHFEYANPDAPKGGRLRPSAGFAFDSFNPFILKGDRRPACPVVRQPDGESRRMSRILPTVSLLTPSSKSEDGLSITFFMRPEARFSDGSPVTADDVVFSFSILKEKGHPAYRFRHQGRCQGRGARQAYREVHIRGKRLRDLPSTVAGLPILSKAYYDKVDFTKTTLEPPLGSGPYKLADYQPNSFVHYTRREDYWAKDLPVMRGRYNFDTSCASTTTRTEPPGFFGFTSGEYDFARGIHFEALGDGIR